MIRKTLSTLAIACFCFTGVAQATAIHDANLFSNTLASNDDSSTGAVTIGFNANYFGTTYSQLFVNNNGNVTFDSSLSTFTPFNLLSTSTPIIAPFFADVDTRNSDNVQYGSAILNGHNVFGVNWIDVGYFSSENNKLNSFQLILTDRSDTGAGNFDIEFNYDQIQWETGNASGGTNGLGGDSARAGWSDGVANSYELLGSAVNGAFLDSGPNALIAGSLNSSIAGQYIFEVRNGSINPDPVPEPATMLLFGTGLIGLAATRRKNKKQKTI
ncbi:nidogen-like domain-containing protein [Desulfomarina sp.]